MVSPTTTRERIDNNFTYHPPQGRQIPLYNQLRFHGKDFACEIDRNGG